MDEVLDLDGTAQHELLVSGDVSARELAEGAIRRINALNPALNAVIQPRFDRALSQLSTADAERPLSGLPTLLKDLGCPMAGEPLHNGNRLLKEMQNTAPVSAALTRRMLAGGMNILGRTNVPEFGLVNTTEPAAYGPTHNPFKPGYSTGGSSGGSAVAVATGMVPFAQASDGGGSIRMPAAHCGVFGLKPSRGRISLAPDGDDMEGHTTYGFITRSVRDSAALLDIASGYEPGDSMIAPMGNQSYTELVAGASPRPLRIGVLRPETAFVTAVNPEVNAAVGAAGDLLSDLGHHVTDSAPTRLLDADFHSRWQNLLAPSVVGVFAQLEALKGGRLAPDDAEPMAWWWLEKGQSLSAGDHIDNQSWRDQYRRSLASWWHDGFDLLLAPVLPDAAPEHGYFAGEVGLERSVDILCFTAQFNMTGQPACSVPFGFTADGRPIGVQLVAAYGREDLLLMTAAQIEAVRPWVDSLPLGRLDKY